MAWYLANSACHSAGESGGKIPVTGFHSTIESPYSVSRVAPPTINVSNIIAAEISSHSRTGRKLAFVALIGSCIVLLAGDGADHIVRGDAPQLSGKTVGYDDPDPQTSRRRRAPRPRHRLGPFGHGAGAIRTYQHQRLGGDDLLHCRRAWLGAACDAADQLDGKTRRYATLSRRNRFQTAVPAPDISTFK